jgi:putative transposase
VAAVFDRHSPELGLWSVQPQRNAYVERFNRTVRYEWLSQYHWENLEHVQSFATEWMWTYNHGRPNMALGGITPRQRLAIAA